MQDRENSTPEGADESGLIKPEHESEHGDTPSSDSEQPEKVYDFYHQHFGVALAAGSQEIRNAEANGRAAYAARTEVADKVSAPKSESWNALKSLIRYQTSSTPAPASQTASDTTSGDSFEAQWFGKNSEDSPDGVEPQEQEGVRLKWTPIVDNVPDAEIETELVDNVPTSEIEAIAAIDDVVAAEIETLPADDVSDAEAQTFAANSVSDAPPIQQEMTAENHRTIADSSNQSSTAESILPPPKKFVGMPSRMVRRPQLKQPSTAYKNEQDAPASTDRSKNQNETADESTLRLSTDESTLRLSTDESTLRLPNIDESTLHLPVTDAPNSDFDQSSQEQGTRTEPIAEEDDASEIKAAEVRNKFGSMNAFAKLQQRTKEIVETKEEQSITGDIPEEVREEVRAEVQSGEWETISLPEDAKSEGATVMNQWCSTSTGDSHPKISLAELDSIPTPSVMKDMPQNKPFSLSTPKPATPMETSQPTPDSVHQTARASWLKAASEYSTSVIKAVTEQMKMLSAKPKKVTPESPEFRTAEPPESEADDSST
ncbi:MAG: hypothetical protein EKK48_16125 [Candidatus Melainabacteria bacterium]|nr:MAG: hypothetical protein EKK48_16125 [Candidatus Melainabacteria bacterium]